MKLQTFLFVLVATLTCRAENSTSPAAVAPAQKVEAAKPVQGAVAAAPSAKPAELVAQANPVDAPKTAEAQKADLMAAMAPVVVKGTSDLKPMAMDLKMDLADTLTGKHAAIAQQLADDAQAQKAAFAHFLAIEQPALSAPQLPNIATPAVAFGQPKKP